MAKDSNGAARPTEEVESFRRIQPDLVEMVGCMVHSNQGTMSDEEAVRIFNQILSERTPEEMMQLNILFATWTAKLVEDLANMADMPVDEVFRLICAQQMRNL